VGRRRWSAVGEDRQASKQNLTSPSSARANNQHPSLQCDRPATSTRWRRERGKAAIKKLSWRICRADPASLPRFPKNHFPRPAGTSVSCCAWTSKTIATRRRCTDRYRDYRDSHRDLAGYPGVARFQCSGRPPIGRRLRISTIRWLLSNGRGHSRHDDVAARHHHANIVRPVGIFQLADGQKRDAVDQTGQMRTAPSFANLDQGGANAISSGLSDVGRGGIEISVAQYYRSNAWFQTKQPAVLSSRLRKPGQMANVIGHRRRGRGRCWAHSDGMDSGPGREMSGNLVDRKQGRSRAAGRDMKLTLLRHRGMVMPGGGSCFAAPESTPTIAAASRCRWRSPAHCDGEMWLCRLLYRHLSLMALAIS